MTIGHTFSPIDSFAADPDAPDCWCTDAQRANGQVAEYCPRDGENPDYSLATYPDAARRWRAEQAGSNSAPNPPGGETR